MFEDSKQQIRRRMLRESYRAEMERTDISTLSTPLSKQLERYKKHMEENKKCNKK